MKRTVTVLALVALAAVSASAARLPVWKTQVEKENAEMLDMWGGACSIYCLIGPEVRASSHLAEKGRTYPADQAHDFDLETAWAEGKPGYGIGEYLEYTYDTREQPVNKDTGIDAVHVFNGYRKSRHLFEANSRVKRFRLLVNGQPHADIQLRDTPTMQTVKFKPISLKQKSVTRLRFVIAEVYPGSQYQNTVVTDLTFEGVGHH